MANTGTSTDGNRTMYIRFQSGDEGGLRNALRALDRDETPDPHFEVIFDDPDDIHRVTRPKNLELLWTIAQYEPKSIVRQHGSLTVMSDRSTPTSRNSRHST